MPPKEGVNNENVKMCCDKKKFPPLQLLSPHYKPHGLWGLRKHYNIWYYPKMVHGPWDIIQKTCTCFSCTTILNRTWYPGTPHTKQQHFKPVVDFKKLAYVGRIQQLEHIQLYQ